jgi:hypothetical protein
MRISSSARIAFWATVAGLCAASASADLLTVDQAFERSQKTGRPIFAVAGSQK